MAASRCRRPAMSGALVTDAARRPQRGGYSVNSEQTQISFRRPQHRHVFIRRRPNRRIGRTEKQDASCANRGGDVRNSAVVPNEERVFKQGGEVRQREILRESNRLSFPGRFQQPHALFVGFPRDHQNRVTGGEEVFAQFLPILDRPILCLASAARMKGDDRVGGAAKKISSELAILFGRINRRRLVLQM